MLIVQGSLRHLPTLPESRSDPGRSLSGSAEERPLDCSGTVPDSFPNGRALDFGNSRRAKVFCQVDAFAIMIEIERQTYEQWLISKYHEIRCG